MCGGVMWWNIILLSGDGKGGGGETVAPLNWALHDGCPLMRQALRKFWSIARRRHGFPRHFWPSNPVFQPNPPWHGHCNGWVVQG